MFKKIVLILFALFITLPSTSFAQNFTQEEPLVRVKLLAEHGSIQPDKPFWVAVKQDIEPGWHTYWDNPGDSGLKTKVQWYLPPGFKASSIVWPAPHRQPMSELINYGYSDEVVLLTKITPSPNLKEGQDVRIAADSSWLVCKETCIPESIKGLVLTLPVKSDIPEPSEFYDFFDKARKALPVTMQLDTTMAWDDAKERVTLKMAPADIITPPGTIQDVYFYPRTWGLIKHAPHQNFSINDNTFIIETVSGDGIAEEIESLNGVLAISTDFERFTYDITLPNPRFAGEAASTPEKGTVDAASNIPSIEETGDHITPQRLESVDGDLTLWGAILFAFLGGLALNLMPCVFPILSMKALSLVNNAHKEERGEAFKGGLAYTLGILVSFAVLGIALLALQTTGTAVGWGAQLQSPTFVLLLIYVLFLLGLMLSGILTIGSTFMGIGQNLTAKKGYSGDFFTGALATVVATPCTAPFMGAAIFYALTQPWHVSLLVLEVLGLGLALPYLVLATFPRLLKFLPKPGLWMEHFKQFLAFPMYGAAIWLVWVLAQSAGEKGVLLALSGCLAIAFGVWLWQTRSADKKRGVWSAFKALLALVAIGLALFALEEVEEKIHPILCEDNEFLSGHSEAVPGKPVPYSAVRLDEMIADDTPVFVNMTAAWCITCLANERVALSSEAVKTAMKEKGIIYMKGDWTMKDSAITEYLSSFGRRGVPIYVYYPADYEKGVNKPVVLPQLLTTDIVLDAFERSSTDPNCSVWQEPEDCE